MKKRIYALDLLKFVAAIIIIFYHYQGQHSITFPSFNFYGGAFSFGNLVELFFVISGYFMYSSAAKIPEREHFSSFMKKRCIRLLPVNALAAAAHCVYMLLQYGGCSVWGWMITSLGLFALGGEFSKYNINAPAWYISVLLICYVWFYVLTYCGKKKNIPLHWLFLLTAFVGLLVQTYGYSSALFNSYTSRGYFAFFIGVLVRQYTEEKCSDNANLVKIAGAGIIGFVLICCTRYDLVADGINCILTLMVYPAVVIVCSSDTAGKIFKYKWMGVLGEVSFGMYLWHTPVFQLMGYCNERFQLGLPYHSRRFMVFITGMIVVLGFASFYLLEKPVTKYLQNKCFTKNKTEV